jgi:hypothetical protein
MIERLPPSVLNFFDAIRRLPRTLRRFPREAARAVYSTAKSTGQTGVFSAWLVSFILILSLLFGLTWETRMAKLTQELNAELASQADGQGVILDKAVSSLLDFSAGAQLGQWFTITDSQDKALLGTLPDYGAVSPILFIVDNKGSVIHWFPIGSAAKNALSRMHPAIIHDYIRRIEKNERPINGTN